jgi:hypothetical protein
VCRSYQTLFEQVAALFHSCGSAGRGRQAALVGDLDIEPFNPAGGHVGWCALSGRVDAARKRCRGCWNLTDGSADSGGTPTPSTGVLPGANAARQPHGWVKLN